MKNFFKKITGLSKLEEQKKRAEELRIEAEKAKEEALKAKLAAEEAERISKLTPKELATEKQEPWVDVVATHVDTDNMSNGFFELDWNHFFIVKLINEGFGSDGDTEEEIVDRWFKQMCFNVAAESGIDMNNRSAGYINVKPLANNKSEIS